MSELTAEARTEIVALIDDYVTPADDRLDALEARQRMMMGAVLVPTVLAGGCLFLTFKVMKALQPLAAVAQQMQAMPGPIPMPPATAEPGASAPSEFTSSTPPPVNIPDPMPDVPAPPVVHPPEDS